MRFHRGAVQLRPSSRASTNGVDGQPEHVADSIEEIVRLGTRDREEMGFSDHVASKLRRSAAACSMSGFTLSGSLSGFF